MVFSSIWEIVQDQDDLLGKFSPQVSATIESKPLLIPGTVLDATFVISFKPYYNRR